MTPTRGRELHETRARAKRTAKLVKDIGGLKHLSRRNRAALRNVMAEARG